mmetsp:Transcript_24659/g.69628  ORF Transcript_24659/g.69628 Transcript_24659/m.69628 type:complete len:342 (+) Transcript_24659:179-1204(+)
MVWRGLRLEDPFGVVHDDFILVNAPRVEVVDGDLPVEDLARSKKFPIALIQRPANRGAILTCGLRQPVHCPIERLKAGKKRVVPSGAANVHRLILDLPTFSLGALSHGLNRASGEKVLLEGALPEFAARYPKRVAVSSGIFDQDPLFGFGPRLNLVAFAGPGLILVVFVVVVVIVIVIPIRIFVVGIAMLHSFPFIPRCVVHGIVSCTVARVLVVLDVVLVLSFLSGVFRAQEELLLVHEGIFLNTTVDPRKIHRRVHFCARLFDIFPRRPAWTNKDGAGLGLPGRAAAHLAALRLNRLLDGRALVAWWHEEHLPAEQPPRHGLARRALAPATRALSLASD